MNPFSPIASDGQRENDTVDFLRILETDADDLEGSFEGIYTIAGSGIDEVRNRKTVSQNESLVLNAILTRVS